MKFLRHLLGGGTREQSDANLVWVYVRCGKCGEKIAVMARKGYDFAEEFDERSPSDAPIGYSVRKDVLGRNPQCFNQMRIEVQYNRNYQIVEQHIVGGTFLTKEEYQAPETAQPAH
jgi:hypothetical protein